MSCRQYVITYAGRHPNGRGIKGGPYYGGPTLRRATHFLSYRLACAFLVGPTARVVPVRRKVRSSSPVCSKCGYDSHGGRDPNWVPGVDWEKITKDLVAGVSELVRLAVEAGKRR